jgi:Spy/CpxP family protein refolding chaperone
MKTTQSIVRWAATLALATVFTTVGITGVHRLNAAAPPPPPHQRLEDAVAELDLTPEQREKVDAAIADLQRKQRQLHEDFHAQLEKILTAEQMQKLQQPDGQGPNHQGPPNDGNTRAKPSTQPTVADARNAPKGTVIFTGGFDTDPRDHGRPVILIAAALAVPSDVFRTAFSGVKPAPAGEQPQDEQVQKNKAALMKVLEPYGVTNDRLNTVSNYYRYAGSRGEMWRHQSATATAIIKDGVVTGIKITDAGAGYSSAPTVSVAGYDDVHATAELSFGTDFKTNGSVKAISLEKK